MEKMKHDVMNT